VCTLALAWQEFENTPLAVAANRDEALGRPADPPGVYRTEPRVIAPRDASAGGTWIGYNAYGLFVAITNRWVEREGARSRGLLVADALGLSSASAAVDRVREAVTTETYAGFNLVVADADRAVLLEYDGNLRVTDLDPGVHVVVNVGADGRFFEPDHRPDVGRQQADNAEAVRAALRVDDPAESLSTADDNATHPPSADDGDRGHDDDTAPPLPSADSDRDSADPAADWLAHAARVLGDHAFGVCVHGDGFGTRSASLIAVGRPKADEPTPPDRYWFADGPPCRTRFQRVESRL